jgi:hypothetical protein
MNKISAQTKLFRLGMLRLLLASITILLSAGCQSRPVSLDPQEITVYQTIIDDYYPMATRLILLAETTVGPMDQKLTQEIVNAIRNQMGDKLLPETIKDFLERINTKALLNSDFKLKSSYVIETNEEIRQIFLQENGWTGLQKHYPGAVSMIKVSRVGFNPTQDQALVYLEITGEGHTGGGTFILLNHANGEWRIMQTLRAWIA